MKLRPPLPAGPYLVVGLARSGVAGAIALRERGEEVIGVDGGAPDGLGALADAGVELHLGEDGVALLDRVGAVVKSPGVPGEAPVIGAARARGMPVLGELELGWRLSENEVIAVTGTNGKTTTVELIGHIHRQAGLPVAVAGNVGAALSGFAGKIGSDVTVVCEASSFQLEDTLAFAPEAAVLLNIAPDHLDRHHGLDAYTKAKLEIFVRQSAEDVAVTPVDLGVELPGTARRVTFGERPDLRGGPLSASVTLSAGVVSWQGEPLLRVEEIRLRGAHNVQNAMAAAAVCLARGLDPDAVRAGLRTFAGVSHRLEEVAREDGVLYVNDSKATNVASALVALEAFAGAGGPAVGSPIAGGLRPGARGARVVHLILGGQGKGQDFSALRAPVERRCRGVYLIGEDAPALAAALAGIAAPVRECGDLEHALADATAAAQAGDVVLLSPACASFDQFADFEARGERFRELVGGGEAGPRA
ncbi:MAG TPA: UDP-N-acetylmuramoyl-L-alanine--D-glutamate ligase [Solirubrobacteraceae bacterium]|nr:UDP-N-acetylmuramoyl-L-alanine--D-glutamate ligase [Solirubrobacteraceae bacterium]